MADITPTNDFQSDLSSEKKSKLETQGHIDMKSVSGWKAFGSELLKGFLSHDHMTLAAALAFYTALSLAPLLLITLAVVGLMGESSQNQLLQQIEGVMGPQAAKAIQTIVESADNRPQLGNLAGIIGVLTLLFSASGVFAQLQSSLNIILEAQAKTTSGAWAWIRKRILSMGMVISLGFLAIVSLIVSAVLAFFFRHEGSLWMVLNWVVTLGVFSAMFALVFKYLPDAKLKWKQAFTGGIVTAVLFTIGKSLIGLYLGKSAMGSAYGAAGSLIVLLAWVYYSAIIVFVGAEITRILAARAISFERMKVTSPKAAQKFEPQLSHT